MNLPISYVEMIKSFIGKDGLFPSRSELIRVAIHEFIEQEIENAKPFMKFQKQLKDCNFEFPKKEEEINEDEMTIIGNKIYKNVFDPSLNKEKLIYIGMSNESNNTS